jgi:hypothetical protein
MYENDIAELQADLEALMDEEAPSELWKKLHWLTDHLVEYIGRWLGFARMEDISLEAVFKNKVFFAVLAAINVMNKYMSLTNDRAPCLIKEWGEFKNAVLWSRHTMDRNELDIVEKTFKVFYERINELAGRN